MFKRDYDIKVCCECGWFTCLMALDCASTGERPSLGVGWREDQGVGRRTWSKEPYARGGTGLEEEHTTHCRYLKGCCNSCRVSATQLNT